MRHRSGPREWAEKDREWFLALTPHTQHKVCWNMWRAKNASLPWRRGGEMASFWEAVVALLTPDISGDESKATLRDMRRGLLGLARSLPDLRSDREHPLTRALVTRAGFDCGGVATIPDEWLQQVDEFLDGRLRSVRVAEEEVREEADVGWRMEAVRRVLRGRRRGERVTYAQVAEEMNGLPGRGRRPWLSAGGVRRAYKRYAEEVLDESEFDSSSDGDIWL